MLREWMASYLTLISFASLLLATMIYSEFLTVPSLAFVISMFFS